MVKVLLRRCVYVKGYSAGCVVVCVVDRIQLEKMTVDGSKDLLTWNIACGRKLTFRNFSAWQRYVWLMYAL